MHVATEKALQPKHVAILGAAVWSVGSGLLAKEIEGDDPERVDAVPAR